ncbi:MAG: PIG-L family deacetylase [Acidimicrobiales bacterium]|nr:PIG-L family deacetylase [Acidimicrobiales bacterium]
MTASSRNLPVPARALAVGAHPDDVEFGAGATLAKWAAQGCEVSLVVCTDGSKGTWDPDTDTAELVATRQSEARAAATALGATGSVHFLGRVDGDLENERSSRSDLVRVIRQVRPDVLLGHDPWKRYRLHPDHRAAGFLTCDALVAARDPHFFRDQDLTPHRPSALLLFEADEPDHAEVVDDAHFRAKLAALESHRSQFESTMFIGDGADHEVDEATARFRSEIGVGLADAGAWAGVPLAERFRFMPTDR